jgi:hypothetical protein
VGESARDGAEHTAFHDADWALPAEEVKRLAEIRDRFAPEDEVQIAAPLFDEGQMIYESTELPHEEREPVFANVSGLEASARARSPLGTTVPRSEDSSKHSRQIRIYVQQLCGSEHPCRER